MLNKVKGRHKNYDVLYITYDGFLDPLGKSQIIPYLRGLSKKDIKYVVLSYEKKVCSSPKFGILQVKKEMDCLGIIWKRLRYHKSSSILAKFFNLFIGYFYSLWFIKRYRIKIIHARSYVAALIALFLKKTYRVKFIFDMRGFWVDERVEAGIWKRGGWLYRISRYFERLYLQQSDAIICLTEAAKKEIQNYPYLKKYDLDITVIPTCVDLARFRIQKENEITKKIDASSRYLFIYTGSVSTWFMPYEILKFFKITKRNLPEVYFVVLTPEKEIFEEILRKEQMHNGYVSVFSADYTLVPEHLSLCKVGLAFYKPGYSRKACCPTKIGEYLACGLAVIINKGVGDTEEIIKKERVGIIIEEFTEQEYNRVANEINRILLEGEDLKTRCRAVAKKYFSLERGVEDYRRVYQRLIKK